MHSMELNGFRCFFCGERFRDKDALRHHQDTCRLRSPGLESLFGPPRRTKLIERRQSLRRKRSLLQCLNLQTRDAQVLLDQKKVICNVIVIDDSEDSDVELPASPTSPRRLIPTDGRTVRRSSSICLSRPTVTTTRGAEKLLRIDVCSLLGQRLKDHMHMYRSGMPESAEYDRKLSSGDSGVVAKKLNMCMSTSEDGQALERLRQPSEYKVTFRATRQHRQPHCHQYRFSRRQRKKFCNAFDHGLSVRSMRLLARMKPCRVKLETVRRTCDLPQPHRSVDSVSGKCDDLFTGRWTASDDRTAGDLLSEGVTPPHTAMDIESLPPLLESLSTTAEENVTSSDATELYSDESQMAGGSIAVDRSGMGPIATDTVANDNQVESPPTLPPTVSDAGITCSPTVDGQTADKQPSSKTSRGTQANFEELQETVTSVRRWSLTAADLSALVFLCSICGEVVECARDVKSLISDHYTCHGVTNIELLEETTSSGQTVTKLIELPATKPNRSTGSSLQSLTPTDSNTSIVVGNRSSSMSVPGVRKKRLRVTWADEVYKNTTPTGVEATKRRRTDLSSVPFVSQPALPSTSTSWLSSVLSSVGLTAAVSTESNTTPAHRVRQSDAPARNLFPDLTTSSERPRTGAAESSSRMRNKFWLSSVQRLVSGAPTDSNLLHMSPTAAGKVQHHTSLSPYLSEPTVICIE